MAEELPSATASKLATAKQKKDTADEAFKSGNVKDGAYFTLSDEDYKSLTLYHISFEILSRGNRFQYLTARLVS